MLKTFGFTNAVGTITSILAMVGGILSSLGCVPGATDFAATCNIPWLPEQWLPIAAGLTGLVAFGSKLFRPGGWLHSLFGGTAVVVPASSPQSGPGTVTPAQVASK